MRVRVVDLRSPMVEPVIFFCSVSLYTSPGMDWRVFMGLMFISCAFVVVWGAWQGWFSPKKIIHPPELATQDNTRLQQTVQSLNNVRFEQSNDIAEKDAIIADLQRKLLELTDIINDLTTKLNALESENAELRKQLQNALDDLAKCRSQLQKCNAELAAKRITDAYCKIASGYSSLLR